jgi:hypothetical protein
MFERDLPHALMLGRSQCSASTPFMTRARSAAIQLRGLPVPENPHDEPLVGEYQSGFIVQRRRLTLDQIKRSVTPRQDMSAALDVLAPQLNVRLTIKRFLRAGLTEPAASLLYVRG